MKVGTAMIYSLRIFRRKLNQATTVLEKLSAVEQRLKIHHDVVAQLSENQHQATRQGARSHLPDKGALGSRAPEGEETLGYRDQSPTAMNLRYPRSDQTTQPIIEDTNDPGVSGGAISGNGMQHESPQPVNTTTQGSRLHISDFIQGLSE